jgi:ferredoxin like protein
MTDRKTLSLEDKIFLVKIEKYRDSHLVIRDGRVCRDCAKRECTTVCPVGTYTWEEAHGRIAVAYENCFECGTCRLACPWENIGWEYPPGGFGVGFRFG